MEYDNKNNNTANLNKAALRLAALTLFPMGGGRGISQSIQTISFQTRIELHGRKLDDNMVSSIPHILEE